MSVFCLKDPDAVFIGIPKTGSSSIREGLWKKRYKAHYGVGMPRYATDLIVQGQLSFTFVRHPLDRLASACRDFRQIRRMPVTTRQFVDIVLNRELSYDLFTLENKARHHTLPQTHPAYAVDYAKLVFRFERYEDHVHKLFGILGATYHSVPHIKKTKGDGWHEFWECLDANRRHKLLRYYAEDFERFRYAIPN